MPCLCRVCVVLLDSDAGVVLHECLELELFPDIRERAIRPIRERVQHNSDYDALESVNLTAYEEYSPLYLPATYAITYLLAFTLSTCVIVHTLLYHGRSLLNGVKNLKVERDDIHAKLMRSYPEVPDWWYAAVFCVFFALAIVAAEVSGRLPSLLFTFALFSLDGGCVQWGARYPRRGCTPTFPPLSPPSPAFPTSIWSLLCYACEPGIDPG